MGNVIKTCVVYTMPQGVILSANEGSPSKVESFIRGSSRFLTFSLTM